MNITYTEKMESVFDEKQLDGFFEEWPEHPNQQNHLEMLRGSYARADLAVSPRF